MNRVYSIAPDGSTSPLDAVHCKNEEIELQNLLEKNLDLILGDQIDPDDPRRWLIVKREMAVEDPGTAEGRWSLDFLLVDQDGVPTLVECKRFKDTRARREVIGQMFDYAANASFYLSRDTITRYLEEEARRRGVEIEALLGGLQSSAGTSLDAFLDLIENNINEGQLRLIFFMEQAPPELRSIVAFENSQMERTEVCLVEARQFAQPDGVRVVLPTLFGYTERARRVKKTVTVQKSGQRRGKWNQETFREDAIARLQGRASELFNLYDFCAALPDCEIKWGGDKRGSFSVVHESAAPKSFISVMSDGEIWLNFQWLNGSPPAEKFREIVFDRLLPVRVLGLNPSERMKSRTYAFEKWSPARAEIQQALELAVEDFGAVP